MSDYGWIDDRGELRPRDWEEHCKYFRKIPAPAGWEHKPQTWAEYCRMVIAAPDWPTTKRLMQRYYRSFDPNRPNLPSKRMSPPAPQPRKEPKPPPSVRRVYDPPRENQSTLAAKRRRLLRMSPHCFWCGCRVGETLLETSNRATIDHLYSRLHPHRPKRYSERRAVLHVLACNDCNQERALAELRGEPFIPKLAERLEHAQLACAVNPIDAAIPESHHYTERQGSPKHPRRTICTIEEAIAFAREHQK